MKLIQPPFLLGNFEKLFFSKSYVPTKDRWKIYEIISLNVGSQKKFFLALIVNGFKNNYGWVNAKKEINQMTGVHVSREVGIIGKFNEF